jgi:hypothetical protein
MAILLHPIPFNLEHLSPHYTFKIKKSWRGVVKVLLARTTFLLGIVVALEVLMDQEHQVTMEATILNPSMELINVAEAHPRLPKVRNPPEVTRILLISITAEFVDDRGRKRKKRNRWGDAQENKAAGLMGLATAITANMTSEQDRGY